MKRAMLQYQKKKGDDSLLIWDLDNDLYVRIPEEGLYKVDENDIWFLCSTTTTPIP